MTQPADFGAVCPLGLRARQLAVALLPKHSGAPVGVTTGYCQR